jgi:hypothetical protein
VDYNMQLSMKKRINARLPLLGALSERETNSRSTTSTMAACAAIRESLGIFFSTFYTQRNVCIVHPRLGALLWTMRVIVLFYFVYITLTSYALLEITVPNVLVSGTQLDSNSTLCHCFVTYNVCPGAGWWEPGTLYTGRNQTYLPEGSTQRRPVDVINPHYCVSPYTDTYYESAVFQYTDPKCVWLPEREMWLKSTPTSMFVTTFYFDHKSSSMPCSDAIYGPRCNQQTPGH